MRLDKFLKVSRLIKRRTVANEACDAGRVTVNGRPAKASVNVKVGDIIEIAFGQKTVKVKVLNLLDTTKKEEAKDLLSIYRLYFHESRHIFTYVIPQMAAICEAVFGTYNKYVRDRKWKKYQAQRVISLS